MSPVDLKRSLRFYFITDDSAPELSPLKQVEIAIQAGATFVQYRHKSFSTEFIEETRAIRTLCRCNGVPFVVNDNILLAKAVDADGVHLGQEDENPSLARRILGENAIVGVSVSSLKELAETDLSDCDYIGTGPVFPTCTKPDAKEAIGVEGLRAVVEKVTLPVVAIGAINSANAASCFDNGASGISVISHISRALDPFQNALELGAVCGCPQRSAIETPWSNEFGLIDKLLRFTPGGDTTGPTPIKVAPGDDACLLSPVTNPVITTDTQKEGVHFVLNWQEPEQVGYKAVVITLSDLAASYAAPVSLFINLGLPDYVSDRTVERLYKGVQDALETYRCALGGGNISSARQLSMDLFAIGQGKDDFFPTRDTARPGDGLYCTGPLGLACAGLQCLMKKDFAFETLIERFRTPVARFDAAEVLADNRVSCVMDISDGLYGDAGHIAKASRLSVAFELQPDDFDPALIAYCNRYNRSPAEMVLKGGEDYELLFACPPEIFETIKEGLPEAFQVGRLLPYEGEYLTNVPPGISSFQHGKK